jgi:hypothetical protein
LTRSSQRSSASCSWGSSRGPTIIDVLTKLLPDDNVSKQAAQCMVSHGQVRLGNYTFAMSDMDKPLDPRKARGRMLKYGARQTRLLGSAPIEVTDQLELASAAA